MLTPATFSMRAMSNDTGFRLCACPDNFGAGSNDFAAADGTQNAPSEPGLATGPGGAIAVAAAAAPAACGTTGATMDTAGGGSTCPSPSFMQPNTSALQERTVQQQGSVPLYSEHVRRSILGGGSKAMTPGGAKLPVPDSECGTSAITTGAQANGGDGAPTPFGGCTSGIINPPGSGRRQDGLEKGRTPLGGGGGVGSLRDGRIVVGPRGALTGNPGVGTGSITPQAIIRRAEKGLGPEASPMDVSIGCGLSSHTCNDRMDTVLIPPDSTGRRTAGGASGGGGGAAAAALSERKAPRPVAASAFFAKALAAVDACNGGGGGGGGYGSHQSGRDYLLRPPKRMCVQDTAEEGNPKRTAEPSPPVPAPVTERQLEEMTEEEQLELALQMSLVEEGGGTCGCVRGSEGVDAWQSSGAGTRTVATAAPGSDYEHLRRGAELTVPTAAGTALRQSCGGPGGPCGAAAGLTCTSGDSAGGGERADGSGGGGHNVGACDRWQSCDKGQSFMELQDESQGGYSMRHKGEGGHGGTDGGRMTSSGPALSGSRGGKDDEAESDCSAGQTLPDSSGHGIPLIAARLERRRARKRRLAKLFVPKDVPDVAESPAVAPSRQRRRGNGSGYGDEGRVHGGLPVAYSVDDQDDGTTALSPISRAGKHQAILGNSGHAGGSNGVSAAVAAADQTDAAPEDDDEDFLAAKRLSLATFAEEKGRRMRRSCGGAGTGVAAPSHKSRAEMKWELMMALPEPEDALGCMKAGPEEEETEAGSGCSTPKRNRGATRAQEDAHVEPPPPPSRPRRRSAPGGIAGGRQCGLTGSDDDGGRSGGMDALVAAAGLHTANHMPGGTTVAPVADATDRRTQSQQQQQQQRRRRSSAGVPAGDDAGNGEEQFKFGFIAPDAVDRAGASTVSPGGLALGVAGSRREDPVDLTGDGAGDEEDPDLAKAIMLSLQDAQQQNNAMGDEVGNADPHPLMDLAKMDDADDGNNVVREPDKPKVVLVPDSDYEEDPNDGEGVKAGSGGAGPAEAGTSRPAAKTPDGASVKIHQSQRPGRHEDGNPSDAVVSVPLAQFARYRLQGVVRHKGWTPFSGHYVADVLVPTPAGTSGQPAQIWYEHNDAVVSHVDFARVREDAAKQGYLFFFVHVPRLVTPPAAALAAAGAAAAENAA
ncbi:hypothetical protein Vretimale_17529 [Volvox reticuliferus]|uniref:Peptidase C19 ubiquitin carboxyl-terminal hydrolase domain-containing protein n=1 Tax=Volvox reticuliferus TaxID=1737510 RepID=A0A8J4CWS9_9CHLO|nr:hypothetical protein Vretifemale_18172 [Volvox reticuliferus]GIM14629.1 hypothetical protein Vretimale_17529 [Volvox reticuliferus]